MKHKTQTILIAFTLAACFLCATSANAQVQVILRQPPPYQFKIENMWKVSLMNPTRTTYQVYLIGRATERNDGRIVEATTTKFLLLPGLKIVNGHELAPLDVKESNSKYSDVVKNIGGVPSGVYDICVSVYNAIDNTLLGEMCVESMVQNLTQVELLQPDDGVHFSNSSGMNQSLQREEESSEIRIRNQLNNIGQVTKTDSNSIATQSDWLHKGHYDESALAQLQDEPLKNKIQLNDAGLITKTDSSDDGHRGDNKRLLNDANQDNSIPLVGGVLALSWLPPAPIPPSSRVTYTLRIVEMLGRQSPYDAVNSNPGVIVLQNIPSNIVQLPLAARRLQPGRSYAWKVDVYLNNVLVQKSDVRHFFIEEDVSARKVGTKVDDYGTNTHLPRIRTDNYIPFDHKSKNNFSQQTTLRPLFASLFTDPEFLRGNVMEESGSEPGVNPFVLKANARINAQYASRIGSFSEQPESYITADLHPGVQLYGLPFSTNILYSSLQESNKQSINSFGMNFDFDGMRQGLASRLQKSVAEIEAIKSLNPDEINKIRHLAQAELDSAKALSTDELDNLRNAGEAEIEEAKSFKADKLNKIRNMSETELESMKSFNTDELNNLRNPNNLTDNLQHYASIDGTEKLFMSIRSLGIGTNYPSYSEYVLSGVPVTGMNLELNPGIFYTAFTASKNQRAIDNEAYRRDLYAGRIGIGKKEATHLFFNGMYVSDDAASIRVDTTNQTLTPRENYVFGLEGKLNLFDDHLALETEGAVSLLTRDTRDAEFASSAIPGFLKNMTHSRISSSVDYTYTGRLAYMNNELATKVSVGVKMIGPGYASLGVPNLRTDQFGYEAKLDQKFFERHVSLGTFFRTSNDNLIAWKSSTTTMTAFGINLGFSFPHMPYLRLSYLPNSQTNDASSDSMKIDNRITMFAAMTGYSYPIGSVMASTSFALTGQRSEARNGLNDYRTSSYMIGEMLSFQLPLTVGINLGIIETRSSLGYGMIHNLDVNCSAPVAEIVTLGLGMMLGFERSHNERIGFYLTYSLQVKEGLDFDLRIENTNYNDFLVSENEYREFIVSGTLRTRF